MVIIERIPVDADATAFVRGAEAISPRIRDIGRPETVQSLFTTSIIDVEQRQHHGIHDVSYSLSGGRTILIARLLQWSYAPPNRQTQLVEIIINRLLEQYSVRLPLS